MTGAGRTDLPVEQRDAVKKAVFWEWFTIAYSGVTISVVALVVGDSQAMKTAWIEDMLSVIPQISFLIALLFIRRPPRTRFPYGFHRVMGVGHLVAGVALLAVGGNLAFESVIGLVSGEHAAIGTVRIFGHTIWLGWVMITVMALTVVGPFIYGPAKARLAPKLHNKVLYADADMSKADWTTTVASIVGVGGIGIGWWWVDGAAALFISSGVVWDGIKNSRAAVLDLIDQRARTEDDAHVHPLADRIVDVVGRLPWASRASVRIRDLGQVFHVEAFVVPVGREVSLDDLDRARQSIVDLDWKMQDVVVIPVRTLPDESHP